MHIALLTQSLYSQGAEYVVASLARGLVKSGHTVDILVSAVHSEIAKYHPEVKMFDIPTEVNLIHMPRYRARYNILFLRKYIKENAPDVILENASPYTIPMILAKILLFNRVKTRLIKIEHLAIGLDKQGEKLDLSFSIISLIIKLLYTQLSQVFVVSSGIKKMFAKVYGYPENKIQIIYNPVLDENFLRKSSYLPSHPWLKKKDVPVVVAAGAFSPIKNHLLLFRAFKKLREQIPCRLILFGDGPLRVVYEKELKAMNLTDDVSLPGYTSQLPSEIKYADCFVCSSVIESFSIVIIEALAVGCPVVSTDAPYGPKEILDQGKYGTIVPNHNVDKLKDAIASALNKKSVINCKNWLAQFSSDSVISRYELLIRNILK